MIRKYTDDGKTFYEVQVFVKDKQRKQRQKYRKGITSEREAKKIEFDFKHELLTELEMESEWTWSQWHEEAIRKMRLSLSPATILQYDGRLKKWIPASWKNKLLKDFKDEDVHAVVVSPETENLSSESRQKLLKLIKRVFEMAVEEGVINRNPAYGLKVQAVPKEQRVLTATEAQQLLTEAQKYAHSFYPVWAFALMSGMRSGEMYALRWTDVDLETGTIQVNKQWTNKVGICPPKRNKGRVVPISQGFKKFLMELRIAASGHKRKLYDYRLKEDVTYDDYVLPTLDQWTNGEQAQVLREFCNQIGITPIRFHDLRATFITNLLANGVPLVQVMAIVGHSKMSTTDVYLRLAGVNVKGATEALGYRAPDLQMEATLLRFKPKSGV